MNFLINNVCSLFFLSTKIMTATLQALWRLNQKSLAKFAHIEKMCHFTFYNSVFMQIFCRCNRSGSMNFLKINVFSLFFLHENGYGHLAGLMEANPEELGRICSNRKDVPFYVLQFCIHANFLSVQLLRRYEFFKK